MQTPWDTEYADPDNARDVISSQIPNCLEILRSQFAGTNPPSSPAAVSGQVWYDDNKRRWEYNGTHWVLPPTPGVWQGGVPSVNATDPSRDTDISTGYCCSVDNYTNMVLPALTKKLDAVFAVGNDQGGLDTGSIANSTWYHLRPIMRMDTRVVDYLWSASVSSPTMPTNYTVKGPILLSALTDGSANIRAYDAYPEAGGVLEVLFRARVSNAADQSITATASLITVTAPPIAGVEALLVASVFDGTAASGQLIITSPNETDVAVARTLGNEDVRGTGANVVDTQNLTRRVNSSSQVRARSAQSTTVGTIATRGFRLPRVA